LQITLKKEKEGEKCIKRKVNDKKVLQMREKMNGLMISDIATRTHTQIKSVASNSTFK